MKAIYLSIIIFACLSVGCDRITWTEYQSKEAGFSALFPSVPVKSVQKIDTPLGPAEILTFRSSLDKAKIYQIGCTVIADSLARLRNSIEHVNSARNWILKSLELSSNKLISETAINRGGNQGVELKIAISLPSGASTVALYDIFFIGNTLYQLSVVVNPNRPESPDAEKFLNSFRAIAR